MSTRTLLAPRPAPPAPAPPDRPTLTGAGLAAVLMGVLLPMVDFFVVNVALPTIQRDLHASAATLELVVSAYATAYAVLLVLGGRLGDALGRRRLFLAGMAGFTLASLGCGLAPTAGWLVAARAAQGVAAATMVPQVLATIQAATSGERRGRALGLYGAVGGVAVVVGQLLGGLLVAADVAGTGWRPIFLVNLPLGLAGLWLAARHAPDSRAERAPRLDLPGTGLLAATLLAVLVPLTEGRALGWPAWAWALLGSAPVSAAAFVAVEVRAERAGRSPLVPPSVVRRPGMRRGLLVVWPFFACFGGFMFVYAVAVQRGLRYDALTAGLSLTPMALTFLVASLLSARAVARFGRRVIVTGAALQAAGLAVLAATLLAGWPHAAPAVLVPGLAVAGSGQGLVMSPLFRVVLADVPVADAGAGGGVLATTQQAALALGVALLGSLFVALSARLGMGAAVVVVLAVDAAAAGAIAAVSRGLPDPAAGPRGNAGRGAGQCHRRTGQ